MNVISVIICELYKYTKIHSNIKQYFFLYFTPAFPWFSQTYLKYVEQLLQRHLLFRNTLQERLSAEHWKSLVGDILVQLIGQNDVSWRLIFYQSMKFKPEGVHLFIPTLVIQKAFSDMYLGYTTTLASFLSLEFSRLNQLEKSNKILVC